MQSYTSKELNELKSGHTAWRRQRLGQKRSNGGTVMVEECGATVEQCWWKSETLMVEQWNSETVMVEQCNGTVEQW